MQEIHITSGIPASGKSTWAKQYVADRLYDNIVYLSRDELRAGLRTMLNCTEYFPLPAAEEWNIWIEETINPAIDVGESVVIDQTTINRDSLIKLLASINIPVECKLVFHFFLTPLEECLRRNVFREGFERVPDDVIQRMHKGFFKTMSSTVIYDILENIGKQIADIQIVRHD